MNATFVAPVLGLQITAADHGRWRPEVRKRRTDSRGRGLESTGR
ncbi:hypothetical protein [Rhodococcus indonesiensis]|uniref:Uncharacterized protein n=1 Tax=Rhodococcus indonesiensis TaxID=3055869 RepID=A0ABT7RMF4_9NOCA|nr:hypothetical protein [Rhodococcus indonesiensis]MDM7488826.1 hypothetical protein [Rhodococcus indonesiensis]